MVPVVPDSCCSSSWVLRAIRAEKSVGSAIASSRALVCRLWVWPWVAAIASMQVREALLKTSCAVSDQPEVWLWVRSDSDLGFCGSNWRHQPRPQRPGRAHLRDLHEEVHPDRPEEAQPRRELVDLEARVEAGPDVLHAVGQRVGQLQVAGRPGLLHVVARDRDRVEARHLLRREREDVADDPHARLRRVDVGVADHELLEDVVLDRPRELLRLHPLLLGRRDVERHHRQHRAVHRHRDAHLVQRDAVEQRPGVVDRVDRHPRHADVALHPRVVGVVAAVGRQVEGDAEALLAGLEVAAVERVGLLGGGEAGVLADRPGLRGVHRRVGPAQERAQAGEVSRPSRPSRSAARVERLDGDALGGQPRRLAVLGLGGLQQRVLGGSSRAVGGGPGGSSPRSSLAGQPVVAVERRRRRRRRSSPSALVATRGRSAKDSGTLIG